MITLTQNHFHSKMKSMKDKKNSELHNFLIGASLFIGISMVLGTITIVPEIANNTPPFGSLEFLIVIFEGILGVAIIIVTVVNIRKIRKK